MTLTHNAFIYTYILNSCPDEKKQHAAEDITGLILLATLSPGFCVLAIYHMIALNLLSDTFSHQLCQENPFPLNFIMPKKSKDMHIPIAIGFINQKVMQ